MTTLPDFSAYGYQVTEQLNQNLQGGIITYKALEIANEKPVVIKQFRFATRSDWDSYKAIEREIEVLQGLNHPGIPRYLAQFDPSNGLCLVQEYKEAQPLSKLRGFSPEEIKSIATQVLEILIYLQKRKPSIFHRDIKPENVLVDEISSVSSLADGGEIKAYLIDFGLARIGNSTMALSSLIGGTLGFMPPEQVHNQKLTKASDLYGLGATLICLITQTKSADIGTLVDFSTNKITFKDKVSKFSLGFIQWLEKMVEPNPANRYQNARLALEALKSLDLIRIPEVSLDKLELDFVANSVGQELSKTITVTNTIPDTMLQGEWSVSPHPKDPPHTPDSHSWISFSPRKFESNQVNCLLRVDTSKLKANKNYEREIVLNSNARQEKYYLKVKVKTAPLQPNVSLPPYGFILAFGLVLALISGIGLQVGLLENVIGRWIAVGIFTAIALGIYSSKNRHWFDDPLSAYLLLFMFLGVLGPIGWMIGVVIGVVIRWASTGVIDTFEIIDSIKIPLAISLGFGVVLAISWAIGRAIRAIPWNGGLAVALSVLTAATGILTGIGAVIGFNSYLLAGLTAAALPLAGMLIYPPLKLVRLKAQHRRQESQNLIEP
ncbi:MULTISPECIES: serine/threonine-protein kinase [unclassified Microcystis]|uniref:serine/threonine-protein kinase n=1 Tax=unclassified Microcystis TaxID=2643300 RepID=UPI0022C41D8D|nr:serine/threonine-protein kinase [Microcystis sp. LE19-195.1E]MCZ8248318.1 serine/threonine-protein kinase [Microcystis sp. LE19-195.1E]